MSNFPLPVPGFAPHETYRRARRDTLNFEACGGERHSRDDFALRPYGQMIYFPAKVARRVIERFNRKEINMSDHDEATSQSPGVSASRTGAGETLTHSYGFAGGEMDLIRRGLIPAGWLDGRKSRMALAILLSTGTSRADIAAFFAGI